MPMTEYAESGTVVDDQADTMTPSTDAPATAEPSFLMLPHSLIVPSLTNPRKSFDQGKLAELAASIAASGMHQPVLVRPLPEHRLEDTFRDRRPGQPLPTHELVAGERRLRACKLAGVAELPCLVKDLTDHQVLEVQIVENLQRDDLSELEEAEGYATLVAATGIAKEDIGERIGRSRTYVYGRLKLLDLCPPARAALREGKIDSSTAELIARIPAKHQDKALAVALETFPHATRRSFRKVRDDLLEKFTLDLKTAIFDTSDAVLLELAGACTTCPKRSGQTPELYGDIIKRDEPLYKWGKSQHGSADICTDPDCFAAKKKAHLTNARHEIEAKGTTVVAGSAAQAAVDAQGNVKGAYIALSDVRAEMAKLKKNPRKSLAGADLPPPEIVTIQNPRDGSTIQAVKRADLADAGAKVEVHAKAQDKWEQERKRSLQERAALDAKATALTEQNLALLASVRAAAAQVPRTAFDLQLIARVTWEGVEYEDRSLLATLYGFKTADQLGRRIGQMDVDALGRFCLDCALVGDVHATAYSLKRQPENLLQAAKHYGVKVDAATTPEDALAAAVGDGEGGKA